MIVIVGAANAVNLTDGLDGLAIMPVMIAAGTLGIIAYVVGNVELRRISGRALRARHGRAPDLLPPALIGGGPRVPVVQRAAGGGVHGRYRVARAGRRAWAPSRSAPSTRSCWPSSAGCSWSRRCRVIIQVLYYKRTRQARLPDGADPPPLREEGLGRAADRHPLLDHLPDPGADRPGDAEGALGRRESVVNALRGARKSRSGCRMDRVWFPYG